MTVGMLVAFQSLMMSFLDPVEQLVGLGGSLQEIEGELSRLDDVLRYPADANLEKEAELAPAGKGPVKLSGQLELRNVTFGYARLGPPLIEDFSLTVRPGARWRWSAGAQAARAPWPGSSAACTGRGPARCCWTASRAVPCRGPRRSTPWRWSIRTFSSARARCAKC